MAAHASPVANGGGGHGSGARSRRHGSPVAKHIPPPRSDGGGGSPKRGSRDSRRSRRDRSPAGRSKPSPEDLREVLASQRATCSLQNAIVATRFKMETDTRWTLSDQVLDGVCAQVLRRRRRGSRDRATGRPLKRRRSGSASGSPAAEDGAAVAPAPDADDRWGMG